MSGAVRYFVLNSERRFSVSLEIFCAKSKGTFASFTSDSAILFLSNSSIAKREVRTSIFFLFKKRSLISSATPTIICPSSVRLYFLVFTSGSIKSAFKRNLRW